MDHYSFTYTWIKRPTTQLPICASLWLEPYAQPVIANVLIRFKQNGSILAEARFELCVMNLPRRRVVRFSLSSSRKALRKLSHPVSLYLRTSMFQTKHLSINTTEQLDTQILILIDTWTTYDTWKCSRMLMIHHFGGNSIQTGSKSDTKASAWRVNNYLLKAASIKMVLI